MKIQHLAAPLSVLVICAGCAGSPFKDDGVTPDMAPADRAAIKKMSGALQNMQRNAPSSASLSFNLDGQLKGKKFRAQGSSAYSKDPRRMHILFTDAVFRSTISRFFLNGNRINVFFPTEKKLYTDSFRGAPMDQHYGTDFPFGIFFSIASGTIPMIDGYRITRGLSSGDGLRSMLVLENRRYFQKISFRKDVPDRLLIADKSAGTVYEFLFTGAQDVKGVTMYRNIRFLAKDSGIRVDITLTAIRLNTPVKVQIIEEVKIPKGVEQIRN